MLRHPHSEGFTYAAAIEVKALNAKGTFKEINRPTDKGLEVIPLTWVFTYKFDGDRFLVKYKARICVRGDLQKVTNNKKYSATLAEEATQVLLSLGFKVVQEDLCLFVKGDILLIFYVDDILIFNPPVAKEEADDIGRELSKA
ncbi:uncharacterized protein N7473_001588 [Penicillium subrubescens]|uniref:uncharacterized protein n=1 Tax=Penicillium subrubescens TaxID=1316194 RepID=UPI0025456F0A|nr:uncharacterized protein N7473_001588 [Penicillium subrubescens]KAJ5904672.1 hypothetical protein N7473_001588 [Penicillium subrubescens]